MRGNGREGVQEGMWGGEKDKDEGVGVKGRKRG